MYTDSYRIISFTCRRPGLDVSCTVDHYILGLPFLGCTQTIPEMKETSVNQQYSADILLPLPTGLLHVCLCTAQPFQHSNTLLKNKSKSKNVWSPVPVPKEVESVHRQRFHRTRATPACTYGTPCGQFLHQGTLINMNDEHDNQLQHDSHLILQMNDRRAPILIRADDCWPSFFTVPVFKSNILPLKRQKQTRQDSIMAVKLCPHLLYSQRHTFESNSGKKLTTFYICFIPVLLLSAVESCSLSFSVSSGWS